MTEHARVWWTRVAMLAGLGWVVGYLVTRQSLSKHAVILGRYTPRFFALLLVVVIVAGAGVVFVLGSGVPRLVQADRFRLKVAVIAAWLPGGLLIDLLGYKLTGIWEVQAEWNAVLAGLYAAATLAMLLVTLDALGTALRRAEFWMAVVGVFVALGLIEGALRYWVRHLEDDQQVQLLYDSVLSDPSRLRWQPHHYEAYISRPGWTSDSGADHVNSLGYRGEEIEIPKPDGVYRIVALGGSTTYGTHVEYWQDAYPAQLERILREGYKYTNVEVINGGAGGYTSWETLINLEFRTLDLEPDLIILYQNTNDVQARIVNPSTYRGDNSGRRKMWDQEALRRLYSWPMRFPSVLWRFVAVNLGWINPERFGVRSMVNIDCTGNAAKPDCLGMTRAEALEANPPIYYERNVRSIIGVAQSNGVDVLLLTWAYRSDRTEYTSRPEYQAAFKEQNKIIQRLSDEFDTYFYDFAADMLHDPEYWVDGRHMTPEGNRLRAELIAAYIDEANIVPEP